MSRLTPTASTAVGSHGLGAFGRRREPAVLRRNRSIASRQPGPTHILRRLDVAEGIPGWTCLQLPKLTWIACELVAYLQELHLQIFQGVLDWTLLDLHHQSVGVLQLGSCASISVVCVHLGFALDPVLEPYGGHPNDGHGQGQQHSLRRRVISEELGRTLSGQ